MSAQMNQAILNQGLEYRQTRTGLVQNSKYFKTPDTFQSNNGALFSLFEPFVEGLEDDVEVELDEGDTTVVALSNDCPFGDDSSMCDQLQESNSKLVIADASDEVAALVSEYNTLLANYIILYSKIHTDKLKYDTFFNPNLSNPWVYANADDSIKIGFILETGYLMQYSSATKPNADSPIYTRGSGNTSSGELHACKTFSNILYGSKLATAPPSGFWGTLKTNINNYITVTGSSDVYYIDKMGVANDVTENTNIEVPATPPIVSQEYVDTCAKRTAPDSSDVSLNTYTDIITSTEIFDIDDYITIITTNSKLQTLMSDIIAQMESELVASQESTSTADTADTADTSTSEAGADTSTSEADTSTSEADTSTSEADTSTSEADTADTSEADTSTSEADTSEADTSASEAGADTSASEAGAGTCTYPFNNCTPSGCVSGKCPKMGADCDYKCTSTCCCYDSQCTGTGTGGSNIQHHQQQLQHDHNMLQDINNSVTTLQQQNTNSELTFNKSRYVYILWVILAIIVAIVIFKKL